MLKTSWVHDSMSTSSSRASKSELQATKQGQVYTALTEPLTLIDLSLGHVDAGSPTLGSSRSWKSMEMEIQSLLEKLLDINDSMSRCAASAAPATSVNQKLARHRDILHEFTQEFRRIKGNINSMKEHAELLSSVRDDIRAGLWECVPKNAITTGESCHTWKHISCSIRRKRSRDTLILSTVIAACTLFLIIYWLSK
ncbi:UNVERIFIED_CONTAM: Golgi SNAP receptor complex member 1-2 [Sesamum radiatum]|uniref:Golgi SNAP receptor complex member 1-2 n=1 Tax=Sesamum radiatum TaxID=300843 RepID=A0AAW2KTG3_SESRA